MITTVNEHHIYFQLYSEISSKLEVNEVLNLVELLNLLQPFSSNHTHKSQTFVGVCLRLQRMDTHTYTVGANMQYHRSLASV